MGFIFEDSVNMAVPCHYHHHLGLVSTYEWKHAIFGFLSLAYLTQHDNIQFHPFSCKHHDFILIYGLTIPHCGCMPHFPFYYSVLGTCSVHLYGKFMVGSVFSDLFMVAGWGPGTGWHIAHGTRWTCSAQCGRPPVMSNSLQNRHPFYEERPCHFGISMPKPIREVDAWIWSTGRICD
jgi:hypothetical protein